MIHGVNNFTQIHSVKKNMKRYCMNERNVARVRLTMNKILRVFPILATTK